MSAFIGDLNSPATADPGTASKGNGAISVKRNRNCPDSIRGRRVPDPLILLLILVLESEIMLNLILTIYDFRFRPKLTALPGCEKG